MSARLTVIETVYHQSSELTATTSSNSQFEVALKTDEQPYARTLKISGDWKPFDKGWLADKPTGIVVISNEEGKLLQRIPTTGEKEEIAARIVQLGIQVNEVYLPFAVILPGQSLRYFPYPSEKIFIRCVSANGAKVSYTVYPG